MGKKLKKLKKTRNMSWLYERERKFLIFLRSRSRVWKKLRSRSRSLPYERALGGSLKLCRSITLTLTNKKVVTQVLFLWIFADLWLKNPTSVLSGGKRGRRFSWEERESKLSSFCTFALKVQFLRYPLPVDYWASFLTAIIYALPILRVDVVVVFHLVWHSASNENRLIKWSNGDLTLNWVFGKPRLL